MIPTAGHSDEPGTWEQYVYIPDGCLCWWSGHRDPGHTTPLPSGTGRLVIVHPDCPNRRAA